MTGMSGAGPKNVVFPGCSCSARTNSGGILSRAEADEAMDWTLSSAMDWTLSSAVDASIDGGGEDADDVNINQDSQI